MAFEPFVCPHCGAKIYATIKPVRCPACGKPWPKENPMSKIDTRFSLRRVNDLLNKANAFERAGDKKMADYYRNMAEGVYEVINVHGARSEMKRYHPVFGNPLASRAATTSSPFTIYNPKKRTKRYKSKTFAQVVAEEQEKQVVKNMGVMAAVGGFAVLMAWVLRKKE